MANRIGRLLSILALSLGLISSPILLAKKEKVHAIGGSGSAYINLTNDLYCYYLNINTTDYNSSNVSTYFNDSTLKGVISSTSSVYFTSGYNYYQVFFLCSDNSKTSLSNYKIDSVTYNSGSGQYYILNDYSVAFAPYQDSGTNITINLVTNTVITYSQAQYDAYGQQQYNAGITYADNRLNTNSISYIQGFAQGQNDTTSGVNTLKSGLIAVITAPITILSSALNFTILGINFKDLVLFFLTIGLIVFIIRLLTKGK